jgi:hypothetical protein
MNVAQEAGNNNCAHLSSDAQVQSCATGAACGAFAALAPSLASTSDRIYLRSVDPIFLTAPPASHLTQVLERPPMGG